MGQNAADPERRQLQDRLDSLFGSVLNADVMRIEYKPQFAVPLLEMSSAFSDEERR
jgi:hypothetical protein